MRIVVKISIIVSLMLMLNLAIVAQIPDNVRSETTPEPPEMQWFYNSVLQNTSIGNYDLEFDHNDVMHIAYSYSDVVHEGIRVSKYDGEQWTHMIVPDTWNKSADIDLEIDVNGDYHIVSLGGYHSGEPAYYSYYRDGEWNTRMFEEKYNHYITMEVDSKLNAHVAMRWGGGLSYYKLNSTNTTKYSFDAVSNCYGPTITLDSNDDPHIACSSRGHYLLYYAKFEDGNWTGDFVPHSSGAYTHTQLFLNSQDEPSICYMNHPERVPQIDRVWYENGRWNHEVVDDRVNSVSFFYKMNDDNSYLISDYVNFYSNIDGPWEYSKIDIEDHQINHRPLEFNSFGKLHILAKVNNGSRSDMILVTRGYDDQDPVANAGPDITVSLNEMVTLDASASTDDTLIERYYWDLDDGTKVEGKSHMITYSEIGTYEVELTVVDTSKNQGRDTILIEVVDTRSPVIYDLFNRTIDQHMIVHFDGSSCRDDSGTVAYSWEVHDTETFSTSAVSFVHRFDEAGVFKVDLVVTDPSGNFESRSVWINVKDITPPEMVQLGDIDVDQFKIFSLSAEGCTDNVCVESYNWTIKFPYEDVYLNGSEVNYTIDIAGNYSCNLIIWDEEGNGNSTHFSINCIDREPPVADLRCPNFAEVGEEVYLDGLNCSDNTGVSEWTLKIVLEGIDMFEFRSSVEFLNFEEPGNYTVILIVRDREGNLNQTSSWILVTKPVKQEEGKEGMPALFIIMPIVFLMVLLGAIAGTIFYLSRKKGNGNEKELEDYREHVVDEVFHPGNDPKPETIEER